MKRAIVFVTLLFLGISGIFAQEGIELPEPVFVEGSFADAAVLSRESAPSFGFPEFQEVVYYLWNFDGINPPAISGEFVPIAALADAAATDAVIPGSIRNNKYFVQSIQYTNMAQTAFEEGDYDNSTHYSEEAIKYARLSDEYVAIQLKIKETNDAIAAAAARIAWASSDAVKAQTRYSTEYNSALTSCKSAVSSYGEELWDNAIAYAREAIDVLANLTEIENSPETGISPLPARYIVRPWNISKDCLWNIAGRPWAYGDPKKWRLLYNANRSKLPAPENPNLIHPGMVIDIPSADGETREGLWDASKTYEPLK